MQLHATALHCVRGSTCFACTWHTADNQECWHAGQSAFVCLMSQQTHCQEGCQSDASSVHCTQLIVKELASMVGQVNPVCLGTGVVVGGGGGGGGAGPPTRLWLGLHPCLLCLQHPAQPCHGAPQHTPPLWWAHYPPSHAWNKFVS